MDSSQITTIVVAVIGSGILSVIVQALAARRTTAADANSTAFESLSHTASTLLEITEKRLVALCDRAERMEAWVEKLEAQIATLKTEVEDRDNMIEKLQKENLDLAEQVNALEKENRCKDRKIDSLTKRIKELETRLDALLNGDGDGSTQ
jgi:predicted RNase H-like nuclease (RuvC/YqgF family)